MAIPVINETPLHAEYILTVSNKFEPWDHYSQLDTLRGFETHEKQNMYTPPAIVIAWA